MSIVFDLDGVICEESKPYRKAKPIYLAEVLFEELRKNKCKIIIYTARREKDRQLTKDWLREHKIRYDKLVMGKPKGDLYVDDRAITLKELWAIIQLAKNWKK